MGAVRLLATSLELSSLLCVGVLGCFESSLTSVGCWLREGQNVIEYLISMRKSKAYHISLDWFLIEDTAR